MFGVDIGKTIDPQESHREELDFDRDKILAWPLFSLRIPTISIAGKFEEIYVPGADGPLVLSRKSKALQLLQQVRDEAHRFATAYNRLLRKKEFTK